MAATGEWQVVRHRRRFPDGWRTPSDMELDMVRPYNPYPEKPTWAQMVSRAVPTLSNSTGSIISAKASPASSRPASPLTAPGTRYFFSPHNPTKLRFPPHSSFPEWRGRCFRCCRIGHEQAKCKNPRRCGKCWTDGHVASQCQVSILNSAAWPFQPARHEHEPIKCEPGFDKLLKGDSPPPMAVLPEGRPEKVIVYVERDEDFFKEVDNLNRAVVMYCQHQPLSLDAHQVVKIAVDTGLCRKEEIRVAKLSRERFLIHLPKGLAVETFVKKLPSELWEQGFQFQQWLLLDDASVRMPMFKILLDLVGLPTIFWRTTNVINAISKLGLYLGSVAPEHESDLSAWRVCIATDDLLNIPKNLGVVCGGLEYPVVVEPVTCERGPIYSATDFPILPKRFAPPPKTLTQQEKEMEMEHIIQTTTSKGGDGLITCSRRALMEICQGMSLDSIPLELRPLLSGRQHTAEGTGETSQHITHLGKDAPGATPHGHSDMPNPIPTATLEQEHVSKEGTCNETKQRSFSDSEVRSVLGTIQSVTQQATSQLETTNLREKETHQGEHEIDAGIAGHTQPLSRPEGSAEQRTEPQCIQERPQAVQGVQRNIGKAFSSMQFPTSRHNRFKGLMGRGRGRSNTGTLMARGAGRHAVLPTSGYKKTNHRLPYAIGQGMSMQQQNKIGAPNAGPTSDSRAKYRWTRGAQEIPVEVINDHSTRKGPSKQILKRKPNARLGDSAQPIGPTENILRGKNSGQAAEINLNPAGFFEIKVEKALCAKIGERCGLPVEVVQQALQEDNTERQKALPSEQRGKAAAEEEEMVNLDSASDEEYEMGDEVF